MYLFAPTYTPKMIASNQPQMTGTQQPQMAPAIKLPHVDAIHATEHVHLRTPAVKSLNAVPIPRTRAPKIEPHLRFPRVGPSDPLWR